MSFSGPLCSFSSGRKYIWHRQTFVTKLLPDVSQLQTFLSCNFNREETLPEFACKVESSWKKNKAFTGRIYFWAFCLSAQHLTESYGWAPVTGQSRGGLSESALIRQCRISGERNTFVCPNKQIERPRFWQVIFNDCHPFFSLHLKVFLHVLRETVQRSSWDVSKETWERERRLDSRVRKHRENKGLQQQSCCW